jgi:hypothetical protein
LVSIPNRLIRQGFILDTKGSSVLLVVSFAVILAIPAN